MHAAIELLENYGLVRDSDSLRVAEIAKRKIVRLQEELFSTVLTQQKEDYGADLGVNREMDPFTFLASKSLRGETPVASMAAALKSLIFSGATRPFTRTRLSFLFRLLTLRL
jgi:hypothetical protein